MRIHVGFCYILVFFAAYKSVFTKSLFDNGLNDRSEYSQQQDDSSSSDYLDSPSSLYNQYPSHYQYRNPLTREAARDNLQQNYDAMPLYARIQNKLDLRHAMRNHLLEKKNAVRDSNRDSSAYGVVYRNGKPWGFLEPLPQSYAYQSANNMQENVAEKHYVPTRNLQQNEEPMPYGSSNGHTPLEGYLQKRDAGYSDEKYPAILTNFKIDNKLLHITDRGERLSKRRPTSSNLAQKSEFMDGAEQADYRALTKRDTAKTPSDKSANLKSSVEERSPAPIKSKTEITDQNMNDLKTAINKIQNAGESDDLDKLEHNLKSILGEMGLVENKNDVQGERETEDAQLTEDERSLGENDFNAELEDNSQIGNGEREKREEAAKAALPSKEDKSADLKLSDEQKSKICENFQAVKGPAVKEPGSGAKEKQASSDDTKKLEEEIHEQNEKVADKKRDVGVANYQKEGEHFIRNRRNKQTDKRAMESTEIVKELEKSGELAVSGNKSPLASAGNEPIAASSKDVTSAAETSDEAREAENSNESKVKQKRAEESEKDYELRVERNIQAKIDAIREQVKREIEAQNPNGEVASEEDVETQRRKRDIPDNLIDKETGALDPSKLAEGKQQPHIRKRRRKRQVDKESLENKVDYSDVDDGKADYNQESSDEEESREVEAPEENKKTNSKASVHTDSKSGSKQSESVVNDNAPVEGKAGKNAIAQGNNSSSKSLVSDKKNKNIKLNLQGRTKESRLDGKANAPNKSDRQKQTSEVNILFPKSDDRLKQRNAAPDSGHNSLKEGSQSLTSDSKLTKTQEHVAVAPLIISKRKKRANGLMPNNNVAYLPYRNDEEDVDEEGDEFDDDSFDDRTANFVQKRDVSYNPLYQNQQLAENYDDPLAQDYDNQENSLYGRFSAPEPAQKSYASAFVQDMNADVFENPSQNLDGNYLYEANPNGYSRRKRADARQQADPEDGAGEDRNMRKRNLLRLEENDGVDGEVENNADLAKASPQDATVIEDDDMQKRSLENNDAVNGEAQSIVDLSDADLFGPLPQSVPQAEDHNRRKRYFLDQNAPQSIAGKSDSESEDRYRQKREFQRDNKILEVEPQDVNSPQVDHYRKKRNFEKAVKFVNNEPQSIADMPDADLFGALSQDVPQAEDHYRRKRNFYKTGEASNIVNVEPQIAADLSDTFGALPQNYEGELARFKRVKRRLKKAKESG